MKNIRVTVAGNAAVVALGQQLWAATPAGWSDARVVSPQDGLQVRCHREPVALFQKKAGELISACELD